MLRRRRLFPLIWLASGSLALSGCATTQDLARAKAEAAKAVPLVTLGPNLETSNCLKGRLPVEDGLTLGDTMAFGAERHRDALCAYGWGVSLVRVIHAHNDAVIAAVIEAQREEAEARKRRRWGGVLFWRE